MTESFTVGDTGYPDWPVDIDITVDKRTIYLDMLVFDAKKLVSLFSKVICHTISFPTRQGCRWIASWLDENTVRMSGGGRIFYFSSSLAFALSHKIDAFLHNSSTKEEPVKAQVGDRIAIINTNLPDMLEYECTVVETPPGVTDKPDMVWAIKDETSNGDYKGSFWLYNHSYKIIQSQSQGDCLDCHGTGKIMLLTSTVKCECQESFDG